LIFRHTWCFLMEPCSEAALSILVLEYDGYLTYPSHELLHDL
jgi:hypothetical protein